MVGIDKPATMTSHDVVNRVRNITGERRVGHAGTLDPLASGVLLVMVGPATRLDHYLCAHDKLYRATITFGASTDTDDSEGDVLEVGEVPAQFGERAFAERALSSIIGRQKQLPPVYSAIKVNGKRSYEQARSGTIIDLKPREIEISSAHLVSLAPDEDNTTLSWVVDLSVSKGTYIRSIARDLGRQLGVPAHLGALERLRSGNLPLSECVSLDVFAEEGPSAALDPVALLGYRFFYAHEPLSRMIDNGAPLPADQVLLHEYIRDPFTAVCSCTSGICESDEPAVDNEMISVISNKTLKALYAFDRASNRYLPQCIFQKGVTRGFGI